MSEIKLLKENFRTKFMQIIYKILRVKDVYEKVLKEVTCKLQKALNKSVKSIKKVLQVLQSVRKSSPVENAHHAETSQSTCNANKLTGCNKTQAQIHRGLQSRPEYHKYLLFHNIN